MPIVPDRLQLYCILRRFAHLVQFAFVLPCDCDSGVCSSVSSFFSLRSITVARM